jgi:hypothetical protein
MTCTCQRGGQPALPVDEEPPSSAGSGPGGRHHHCISSSIRLRGAE